MRWYNAPKGQVGRRCAGLLAAGLKESRERKLNSERPLMFPTNVLQKENADQKAANTCCHLEWQVDKWAQGQHAASVDSTSNTR